MIDQKLLTFLTLIEEKSYTKAAAKLYITQPSVTHHIKTLEKELDITLFDDPKTFSLSSAGKRVYDYAISSFEEYQNLKNMISKINNNSPINIAITPFLADTLINTNFFLKLNDILKVYNLFIYDYSDIEQKLKVGSIDLGIIDTSFDSSIFDFIHFSTLKVNAFVLSDGKYQDLKRIPREQFVASKIVVGAIPSGLGKNTLDGFSNKNIKIKEDNIHFASSKALMYEMIKHSDDIGFMYSDAFKNEISENKLKKIDLYNYNVYQNAYIIYDKTNIIDESLIEHLKTMGEVTDD